MGRRFTYSSKTCNATCNDIDSLNQTDFRVNLEGNALCADGITVYGWRYEYSKERDVHPERKWRVSSLCMLQTKLSERGDGAIMTPSRQCQEIRRHFQQQSM